MLLNEIFKGMFDPKSDKLVREISKLFYKTWAPKLKEENKSQYSQLMDTYKDLSTKHKKGIEVTQKLERLRDIVKHAATQPHTDIKLRSGSGLYD